MKRTWKEYLLYGSVTVTVGVLAYILIETFRLKNTGFEIKTLWDWMELLIIPVVLAGGALYLQRSERAVDRKAAEDRADLEREIATDRQREAALQAYLDRIADLWLNKEIWGSEAENERVRNVARIRTLTVLLQLDGRRKGLVLRFLYESGLISETPIINLEGADLSEADLEGAVLKGANLNNTNLQRANLSEANLNSVLLKRANLQEAKLGGASLEKANLEMANLQKADLRSARLVEANLIRAQLERADFDNWIRNNIIYTRAADLSRANLSESNLIDANLRNADLNGVDLSRADLRGTNFTGANLSRANLMGAHLVGGPSSNFVEIIDKQLATAESLEGAIMPDGTKHD